MNTPYQWTKQVASHYGGTRNGTIVRWPSGIDADRARSATSSTTSSTSPRPILEAAGLPEPTFVHGVQQRPYEGVSMGYTFDDADAAERPRDPVLRDVREPRHLPPGLDRGHPALHPVGPGQAAAAYRRRRRGSSTDPTTGPRPTTWPPKTPRSSRTCSRSSCSRRRSTRSSRSTTAGSSGSTPTSPDGRP